MGVASFLRRISAGNPVYLLMAAAQPAPDAEAPGAFPGLTQAQRGVIGETEVGMAIFIQGGGTTTVGYPILDGGFDLYPRRVRTLRVIPTQVKARDSLEPDGLFEVSVPSLKLDPNGYVVLPYVPAPEWRLQRALWAIPIPAFVKIARPHDSGYVFSGYLDRRLPAPADEYLVSIDRLQSQWLHRIPGWTAPVRAPALPVPVPDTVPRQADQALGRFGELWLASELMRVGLQNVVLVQDRLRMDCVAFILHDLRSFAVGGLSVHTATVNARGVVQFRIRSGSFFVDPRLDVALIVCDAELAVVQTFLLPSTDLWRLTTASPDRGDGGYQASFRIDPLPPRWRPYALQPRRLGTAILDKLVAPGP